MLFSSCGDEGGYNEPEAFKNIVIKDNIVKNVGNIAIGVSSCDNCTIENNTIIQKQAIRATAISILDRATDSDDLSLLSNCKIRNSTIIAGQDAFIDAIFMGGEGEITMS